MSRYARLMGPKGGAASSGTGRYTPLTKRKIIPVAVPVALRHGLEAKRRRLELGEVEMPGSSSIGSSPPTPLPSSPPSPDGSVSSMRSTFSESDCGNAGVYAAEVRHAQLKHHWSDRSLETFLKLNGKFLDPGSRGLPASLYHLQQLEERFSYCFGQVVYCCKFCGDLLDTDTGLCTSGGSCKGRYKPDTQLSCAMGHLDIQAQLERIVTGNIANILHIILWDFGVFKRLSAAASD